MPWTAIIIVFLASLIAPAFAQKPEIDTVNAKWMELLSYGRKLVTA
jgi:hypothetical protein